MTHIFFANLTELGKSRKNKKIKLFLRDAIISEGASA